MVCKKFESERTLLYEGWSAAQQLQSAEFFEKSVRVFELCLSIQGRFGEHLERLTLMLSVSANWPDFPAAVQNLLYLSAAKQALALRQVAQSESFSRQVDPADTHQLAELQLVQAWQSSHARKPDVAIPELLIALESFSAIGDRFGQAAALELIADTHLENGAYELAQTAGRQTLEIQQQLGNNWGMARSLSSLGTSLGAKGDYQEAEQLLEQSLELCEQLGDKYGTARALHNIGNIRYFEADFEKAKR